MRVTPLVRLRNKIRKWLGIERNLELIRINDEAVRHNMEIVRQHNKLLADLVHIGVDVHFKKPHMILVYSKLNGGQIRYIDVDFDNMEELNSFVTTLKKRYNTNKETWDTPPHMRF